MVRVRQKEDIMAGAATGGLLQMRQGLASASRSALFGGVILALIEGAGIMINKVMSAQQNMPIMIDDPMAGVGAGFQLPNRAPQPSESSSSSWFGGLFGGNKEESKPSGGVKTKVLESFDSPIPPTFEFNLQVLVTTHHLFVLLELVTATSVAMQHKREPMYECGCGPMRIFMARTEENYGRYFLRCPNGENHRHSGWMILTPQYRVPIGGNLQLISPNCLIVVYG